MIVQIHERSVQTLRLAAVEEAPGEAQPVLPVDAASAPPPTPTREATVRLTGVTTTAWQLTAATTRYDDVCKRGRRNGR